MMPRFLFCDRNQDFLQALQRALRQSDSTRVRDLDVSFHHGNVQEVHGKQFAFVSPANSFGFMDGGIDYAYSREMFHGVERALKARIRDGPYLSELDRPYLPIGSALLVPVADTTHHAHCYLLASPTMWLPQSVTRTRNAYVAFFAVLSLVERYNRASNGTRYPIRTIVCPALCTGVGHMPVAEAAKQMVEALEDFLERYEPDYVSDDPRDAHLTNAIWREPTEVVHDQPQNYMNTEVAGLGL